MCVRICVCDTVCVIAMCMCLCVFVCERERREGGRQRERGRERMRSTLWTFRAWYNHTDPAPFRGRRGLTHLDWPPLGQVLPSSHPLLLIHPFRILFNQKALLGHDLAHSLWCVLYGDLISSDQQPCRQRQGERQYATVKHNVTFSFVFLFFFFSFFLCVLGGGRRGD